MSDLVGNPEDRFFHDEAHFVAVIDSHDKTHVSMKDHFRGLSGRFVKQKAVQAYDVIVICSVMLK